MTFNAQFHYRVTDVSPSFNPRTGDFYPKSGGGAINPKTGEFFPTTGN